MLDFAAGLARPVCDFESQADVADNLRKHKRVANGEMCDSAGHQRFSKSERESGPQITGCLV